jgi:EAL domain-containing protein (putative c-di-GMP-specific phosphodiesterase class I)
LIIHERGNLTTDSQKLSMLWTTLRKPSRCAIDRSFVVDITSGPRGLALVSTIINLGQALNLKLVAEGVETEEQSHLLRLLRCDEMQGYLRGWPVPIDAFEAAFLAPHVQPTSAELGGID